jgi:hypothetical protein
MELAWRDFAGPFYSVVEWHSLAQAMTFLIHVNFTRGLPLQMPIPPNGSDCTSSGAAWAGS